jgi:hypothetical protein
MNITGHLADIEKRLLALKASRKVNIAQVNMLVEQWEYNITVPVSEVAIYQITVQCAGAPIVDVGVDGISVGQLDLAPQIFWSTTANTATATVWFINITGLDQTKDVVMRLWSLNGLSAEIERLL